MGSLSTISRTKSNLLSFSIIDCIFVGLTTKENRELTEASLKVAEKLVRARPDDLKEVRSPSKTDQHVNQDSWTLRLFSIRRMFKK